MNSQMSPITVIPVQNGEGSQQIASCPACNCLPYSKDDAFCRRCGCRLNMKCRYCESRVKPLDRFCASCGTRRIVFFDRVHHIFRAHVPHFLLGGLVVAGLAMFFIRKSFQSTPRIMLRR
ncbi:unnamed protein product, partial [Mesorhabditis belari]|uniref:DZANK-type domain-containing protein n=1 Tax=Mesorhabditis belari TaxID=2138241 RepID=A0AAF3EJ36_9BILA